MATSRTVRYCTSTRCTEARAPRASHGLAGPGSALLGGCDAVRCPWQIFRGGEVKMSRAEVRSVALAWLACIAVLLAIAAPAARASFPGVNGGLAFASDRDGNYEIYSSDAGGVTQ